MKKEKEIYLHGKSMGEVKIKSILFDIAMKSYNNGDIDEKTLLYMLKACCR